MEAPPKIKSRITVGPSNLTAGYPKKMKISKEDEKRDLV